MKGLSVDENRLKRIKAIIQSMTKKERSNPDIINASRKKRIASGSGTEVQDVNRLLKDFEQVNKLMKMMNKKGKRGLKGMKNMPFPF
jgi:signal recognition particle subunit SRP54